MRQIYVSSLIKTELDKLLIIVYSTNPHIKEFSGKGKQDHRYEDTEHNTKLQFNNVKPS